MIKKAMCMSGGGVGSAEIVNKRFTRYMNPVINVSQDAGAIDSSQSWFLDVVDTGTEWRAYYTGANTQSLDYFGQAYANNDSGFMVIKTKSNDVRSGWEKVRDVNDDPKPLFSPSFIDERFDEWQVWIRTIIVEDGIWKAWFNGDSGFDPVTAFPPSFSYRIGYAESEDEGLTWINRTTTPIYSDLLSGAGHGIVSFRVLHDDTNYKMIYGGLDPNVAGLFIAESANGTSGWSITHSNLFANQEFGWAMDFKYSSGIYYVWFSRLSMMPEGNLGPCREILLYSTPDFTTWTNLGVQLKLKNVAQEFGIGVLSRVLQKPDGTWFMIHTSFDNRTQATAGITKEPAPITRIADSNNTSFIMNSQCDFSWPDYVTFHAALDPESGFYDEIGETAGTLSSGYPSYWERGFIRLTGSQTLTFPNNGNVINGANFGIKMRVEIITSGNRELFKIGNDIIITLESGKLRVRLSSDGAGYEKDYITTVNISKPAGLDYIDNHIYISVLWDGSTIRMWNDFVEFTSGQITKTVDDALTTVNNSSDDILIGQNAAIELRSVSVLDSPTAIELQELDI